MTLIPRLHSGAQKEPEPRTLMHEILIEPRRETAREVLRRAIDRAEIE